MSAILAATELPLWRPAVGPLRDSPLAFCDARTAGAGDLVASDLVFPDRIGETYAVAYNPAQRWSYIPGMTPDEALLIKCCDSADDGRARFAPHTAFTDPEPPRVSRRRFGVCYAAISVSASAAS